MDQPLENEQSVRNVGLSIDVDLQFKKYVHEKPNYNLFNNQKFLDISSNLSN